MTKTEKMQNSIRSDRSSNHFRRFIPLLYIITIASLSIYSYTLLDLNLTLFNNDLWQSFREQIIQIGYFRRDISWIIYLTLIILLYVCHLLMLKRYKNISAIKIAFLTSLILLFSYPFLSHDFFNYLFDAKIITFYHQNPYLHKALDFPGDPWLRFMHWTHRTYPYGPSWLILTLIPSFLSFGKFILNMIFFKLLFLIFYCASVFYLSKIDKKAGLFFATNPLVIIEGLISPHNDLIATSFAIIGICYLLFTKAQITQSLKKLLKGDRSQNLFAFIHFPLSAGIKYITLPALLLRPNRKSYLNKLALVLTILLIVYVSYSGEIQPWYFLNLLIFLPYFPNILYKLQFFFFGLIMSYYPYIRLGGWDTKEKVILKHQIIWVFFIINMIYLGLFYYGKRATTRA